jgi:hypothetical protein
VLDLACLPGPDRPDLGLEAGQDAALHPAEDLAHGGLAAPKLGGDQPLRVADLPGRLDEVLPEPDHLPADPGQRRRRLPVRLQWFTHDLGTVLRAGTSRGCLRRSLS